MEGKRGCGVRIPVRESWHADAARGFHLSKQGVQRSTERAHFHAGGLRDPQCAARVASRAGRLGGFTLRDQSHEQGLLPDGAEPPLHIRRGYWPARPAARGAVLHQKDLLRVTRTHEGNLLVEGTLFGAPTCTAAGRSFGRGAVQSASLRRCSGLSDVSVPGGPLHPTEVRNSVSSPISSLTVGWDCPVGETVSPEFLEDGEPQAHAPDLRRPTTLPCVREPTTRSPPRCPDRRSMRYFRCATAPA